MKRSHSIIIPISSAVVAAILVIGGYALLHRKPAAPHKDDKSTLVRKDGVQPKKNAATNKPLLPPQGMPPSLPPIPEMIREGKPPPMPPSLPSGEELREQFALLRKFLELPPDRLARIRESIERIERMTPERKKMMLDRLVNTSVPIPPGVSAKIDVDVSDAPEAIRSQVGEIAGSMSGSEKAALAAKLKNYSSEQRAAYFEGMVKGAESARPRVRLSDPAPRKAVEKPESDK